MSWGISDSAPNKEKIKSEVNDCLIGLNSVGDISYSAYSEIYDCVMEKLDAMANISCNCDNEGYVIYDKTHKCYYEGTKSWKDLHQAQIFNSKSYLYQRVKHIKDNPKDYGIDSRDIVIRKVGLIILEENCD